MGDGPTSFTFDEFCEFADRDGGGSRSTSSSRNPEDVFASFFGANVNVGANGRVFPTEAGSYSERGFGGGPRKAPPIERKLPCSLEELSKGITKKMKITREIAAVNGRIMKNEEILTIDVKPGWKKGTKITFEEKGDVKESNVIPADIIFVIEEKPHSVFTREGNDLIVNQKITLAEALTGYTIHITTLDGRNLNIPINYVIRPDHEEIVPREGMPIQSDPSRRGNMVIRFNVKFPNRVAAEPERKAGIKKLLAPLYD